MKPRALFSERTAEPGEGRDELAGSGTLAGQAPKRPRRLPPLNFLRVFDAVARVGSFTAAADELCVTQSAVSQQVRHLEEFLEVRLFRRLPRRVELTREGTALASAVHESLTMLGRACSRLVDPDTPVVVCVNAQPSLAFRWLVPRLKRFMDANPDIRITLLASNEAIDFDRQDVDIAIRWGAGPWARMRADPLIRTPIFPVCSPGLLESGRRFSSTRELAGHTLLQVVNGIPWTAWFDETRSAGVDFSDTLYFSDSGLMLEAAAQGQGIGLTNYLLAEDDLRSGRLARAFDAEMVVDQGYHILSSADFGNKPPIAAFREWVRREALETLTRGP